MVLKGASVGIDTIPNGNISWAFVILSGSVPNGNISQVFVILSGSRKNCILLCDIHTKCYDLIDLRDESRASRLFVFLSLVLSDLKDQRME